MKKIIETSPRKLSFLPAFLPDETFYSLCARFHFLSGNRLSADTSLQLFRDGTSAMLHDFPTNLAAFAEITEGRLGDADTLARDKTLLKFYVPYQPVKRIAAGVEAMAGDGVDRLKFRLGLPSSRLGAAHPLKACPRCIQEELSQFGGAYWHRIQQHPAIWICSKHDELLMRSTGKSRVRNKLQWILPHTLKNGDWQYPPQKLRQQASLLQRLEQFVLASCIIDVPTLDPLTLRQCYLLGMKRLDWLTKNGSARLKIARESLLDQYVGLLDIPEFNFIESLGRPDGGFLGVLLRNPRTHLHPVKHLVVKSFLFSSWAEFWDAYREMSGSLHELVPKPYNGPESERKIAKLIPLVKSGGAPLAQIARDLEVPYSVARYWLKRAGIQYHPSERLVAA